MKMICEGEKPYWMYIFGDKSKDPDKCNYIMTIWFSDNETGLDAGVEIHDTIEGNRYFCGKIFNLEDLQKVLYLIFDYQNKK